MRTGISAEGDSDKGLPGPRQLARLRARPPLVDELISQLLVHIRSNGLDPGTRLPATAEMAKSFGVAPTTMREALRRLEATGVVSVRHGVGVFVKSDASRLVLLNPDRLEGDQQRLVSLIDARLLIEPPLAERAAAIHSAADAAEMARLLRASEEARSNRTHAGSLNMQFHSQIAQAAGNPVLADMLSALTELHLEDQLIIDRLFDDPERDHSEHVAIFKAITSHRPRLARRLMQSHLDDVLASVQESLRGDDLGAQEGGRLSSS